MRKEQKSQAVSFLRTLDQAHEKIKKLLENAKSQEVRAAVCKILEDCQQGAIELGNIIETSEGEGGPTISLLEQYCELTYQIHEKLAGNEAQEEVNAGNRVSKSLRRLLIQIENSVKYEIQERLEVVFLPYKASMWDSLESIWMAADQDENCDAYVIPIPYYDKNPDGSFGTMHYEGELYPQYVSVTWYEDYDFAGRRPDIIFIHNPYDNNNYVTSVHPFFYAEHIKQFTGKLVYVPYFILDEINPNNSPAVREIQHFCTTPGVVHADQVVVQSEDMRRIYINVCTELCGRDDAYKRYWEQKILGIGSPKVDRILHTVTEDMKIPDKWMQIIQKPDRTKKKIIFYNTSINGLLSCNEKMLAKMREVFCLFKENGEKVALLWRPHPLIESTLSSMRPQLWEEYESIKEQYKSEGWGIYDDSADLNRAVCLSDAYYGDWSSVFVLYKQLHKSIMMQNVEYKEENDNYRNFVFDDLLIRDTHYYITSGKIKGLLKINRQSRTVEEIIPVNSEKQTGGLYCRMADLGEKIIFIPGYEDSVLLYDEKMQKAEPIYKINSQNLIGAKFQDIVESDQMIFLIPYSYTAVVMIDKYDFRVKEIEFDAVKVSESSKNTYFGQDAAAIGTKLYLLYDGHLMEADVGTGKVKKVRLCEDCRYTAVASDLTQIWAVGKTWIDCYNNTFTEHIDRIDISDKIDQTIEINKSILAGRQLFLFAVEAGSIYMFDIERKDLQEISLCQFDDEDLLPVERLTVKKVGTEIFVSSVRKNCVYILEIDTLKVRKVDWRFQESYDGFQKIAPLVNQLDDRTEALYPDYTLKNLLTGISQEEKKIDRPAVDKDTVGYRIYQVLRG